SMALLLMGESVNSGHCVIRRCDVFVHCTEELLGGAYPRDVHAHGNDDVYFERDNRIRLADECGIHWSNGHFAVPRRAVLPRRSPGKSCTNSVGRRHLSMEGCNELISVNEKRRPRPPFFTYTTADHTSFSSLSRCLGQ